MKAENMIDWRLLQKSMLVEIRYTINTGAVITEVIKDRRSKKS